MTEASQSIHTLIYPFTELETNHCPENGLSHLRLKECPNVHIISPQLVTHYSFFYVCEYWLIAPELYKRIPTKLWYVFTNSPTARQDVTQGQFLKQDLIGLNLVFLLFDWLSNQSKRNQPALLFTGGRIIVFITFPKVLVQCEIHHQPRAWFELVSTCPFPATVTITPQVPP